MLSFAGVPRVEIHGGEVGVLAQEVPASGEYRNGRSLAISFIRGGVVVYQAAKIRVAIS